MIKNNYKKIFFESNEAPSFYISFGKGKEIYISL